MGASVEYYKVKGIRKDLNNIADDLRFKCRYENGHGGYSGTIAEDSGNLTIIDTPMSLIEAQDYIDDKSEKWENSIAIKLKDTQDEWLIGGCYSC